MPETDQTTVEPIVNSPIVATPPPEVAVAPSPAPDGRVPTGPTAAHARAAAEEYGNSVQASLDTVHGEIGKQVKAGQFNAKVFLPIGVTALVVDSLEARGFNVQRTASGDQSRILVSVNW